MPQLLGGKLVLLFAIVLPTTELAQGFMDEVGIQGEVPALGFWNVAAIECRSTG